MSDDVKVILLGHVLPASISVVLETVGATMSPELVEGDEVSIAFVEDAGGKFGSVWIFGEVVSQTDHARVYDGERTLLHANPGLLPVMQALVEEFGGYLMAPGGSFVMHEGRNQIELAPADALLVRLQKAVSFTAAKAVRDAIVADPQLAADLVAGIEGLSTAPTAPSPR